MSFVTPDSLAHWSLIEKRHAVKLDLETLVGFEATAAVRPKDPFMAASKASAQVRKTS